MDWFIVALLAGGTALIGAVGARTASRRSLRLKLGIVAAVYFTYSGFGIAADGTLTSNYLIPYFLFLCLLTVGLVLGGGLQFPAKTARIAGRSKQPTLDADAAASLTSKWWSDRTAGLLAAGYVFTIIGQIVLSGSISEVLRPDHLLLGSNQGRQIFESRILHSQNAAYVVLGYAKLLLLPFFYIELQRRLNCRWLLQLLVLCLVTYLQVAAANHWGRVALVQPILVWLLILLVHHRISGKMFSGLVALGFAFVVPVLNALADWRQGSGFSIGGGLLSNIAAFQRQELGYPAHYPVAEAMGAGGDYIGQYLTWLVTLPIPSSLTGASFSVTRDFSERILGIAYGEGGFYILLPGWLGESFIAFGAYYGLWGLLVGLVIGLIDRFTSRCTALKTFDAFLLGLLAVYLRSASQEFIAQAVGCLWLLLMLYVLNRLAITAPSRMEPKGSEHAAPVTRSPAA